MDHPTRLGPYHVQRLLGEGGSAFVYQGYDPRLQRRVALKVLKLASPDWIERLRQEALLQARLQHPQLVQIYDVGEEDGQAYLAMQFIPGATLGEAAKALTLEARVRLMAQVADAVHAAHRQGLIHRDLKPSNVLVSTDEAGLASPHVVDFGLARMWEGQSLTAPGQILGSPAYMAPEQARGEVVDPRTDVYGLGATLYELLAGRPPFQGSDVVSLLLKVMQDEPAAIDGLNPEIPAELAAVVHHCLEKDPARRYPSAAHLRDDLHRYLDGEGVSVRRPGPLQRTRRWVARNRRLAWVLAGSVLVTLALATLLVVGQVVSARQARLARDLGQAVAEIEGSLQQVHLLPRHDVAQERRAIRARVLELRGQSRGSGRRGRALEELALGRGHLALDDLSTALAHLQAAAALGENGPELTAALGRVHAQLYLEGILTADPRDQERRRTLQRKHRDPAVALLGPVRAAGNPVSAALAEAQIALCEDRHQDARRILQDLLKANPYVLEARLQLARLVLSQGREAENRGRYDEAVQLLREAEREFARTLEVGRSHPRAYLGIGLCRQAAFELDWVARKGDLDALGRAALEAFAEAAAVDSGAAMPWARQAVLLSLLGIHDRRQGRDGLPRLDAARQASQQALRLDPEDSKVLEGAATIGMIQGDLLLAAGEDPRQAFAEAERWGARLLEKDPSDWGMRKNLGLAQSRLAQYLAARGLDGQSNHARAETYCQEAVAQSPIGRTYWNLGAVLGAWARDLHARGAEAVPVLERGLAAYRSGIAANPKLAPLHGELGDLWGLRARLAAARKEDPGPFLAQAENCFQSALSLDPKDRDVPIFRARIAALRLELAPPERRPPALEALLAATRRAAELNPKEAEPWLLRARGLALGTEASAALDRALAEVAQARARNPRDLGVLLEEARLLQRRAAADPGAGEVRRARVRELAERLLKENPSHPEALRLRAWSGPAR